MRSKTEALDIAVYVVLAAVCVVCLIPMLHIFAKSFSGESAVISGKVSILPVNFQTGTYRYVLAQKQFWRAFLNTLLLTGGGTAVCLFVTAMTAYPLSKAHLHGHKLVTMVFVFAWIFVPPLVPMYLVMKTYGLIDTFTGLILMDLVIAYNMLVVKTFFEQLPDSLFEAAKVDGAGEFRTFFSVALPLSVPCLVTVGMFIAFYFWNMYAAPRIYINSVNKQPMQMYLYDLIMNSIQDGGALGEQTNMYGNVLPDTIRSATVIISIVPIICVYPFMQRHFVKGMMIGAVKG